MAAAVNAAQAKSRPCRCLRSCRAVGHSAVAECVHSALKSVAVWALQCVGATTGHRWGDSNGGPLQRLWWVGETSIPATNCQESSTI